LESLKEAEFKLYSVARMQDAERRAEAEYGIPLAKLMDSAGRGLARAALDMLPQPEGVIGVFCGSGNNGGDGYVCATVLMGLGKKVKVWGVSHEKLQAGSLSGNAVKAYLGGGGVINPVTLDMTPDDAACDVIVDALLGTGLGRPVLGLYRHAIEMINSSKSAVLSCDLPSGVDADTGQIMGAAVKADRTLVMGLAKRACAMQPGCGLFGETTLCDIGLPEELTVKLYE